MQHVAVGRDDAEVLVLQVGERLGHQDRAGKQHHRQRGLNDNQRFLRQRGAVARGAAHAAQRLGRLRMEREPCRRRAEENAGDQRNQKRKAQHRQAKGWR